MKKCLIVDDSRTMRKIIRQMMESFGFQCEEAENGEEAYKRCQSALPALVMLDWNMPVMNGIEFINLLRALPGIAQPRVIFCTTESDFSFVERALQAGCDEYIMKPFDREIIKGKLLQIGMIEESVA